MQASSVAAHNSLVFQAVSTQNGPVPMHPLSRQTSAKPLYSWQPSSPGKGHCDNVVLQCQYTFCGSQHCCALFAAGAELHNSTSWAVLTQSHQGQETPKPKPKHQQSNGQHQGKAEAPTTADTVREDNCMSSTAGWFAGAAGQLTGSRGSIASVPQLDDTLRCQLESAGRPHIMITCLSIPDVPMALFNCCQHCSIRLETRVYLSLFLHVLNMPAGSHSMTTISSPAVLAVSEPW